MTTPEQSIRYFLHGLIMRSGIVDDPDGKARPIERDPDEEIVHVWVCKGGSMKLYAFTLGPDEIDEDAYAQVADQ